MHSTSATMSSDSSNLSYLARSKLHLSSTGKGNSSLHRWVLLKNSIVNSSSPSSSTTLSPAQPEPSPSFYEDDDEPEVVLSPPEQSHSYMFPDVGRFVGAKSLEDLWLDSLLASLGDDDDDDDYTPEPEQNAPPSPADDDAFVLCSPINSPSSSSDDLSQPSYYPSVSYSYPVVPYPPYQPPIIHTFHLVSSTDSLRSSDSSYENPLPYHDIDDFPVPDAIEDTSDDESDAPATPSLGRSSSSISLVDAASIPLPPERSRLRHSNPRVYVDSNDSYLYSFEIDPLPFPDEHHHTSYNRFQEC